jgi:signal peptidase
MGRASKGVREFLLGFLLLALLVGTASAYAQNWPPAVIVESSSMMHREGEAGFGRLGTIDPGDLVLVKSLDDPAEVETLVEGGPARYGLPGDVIVYRRGPGQGDTPIIHRAIAYVEVADGPAYRVRWDPAAPCVGGADKAPDDAAWCVYGREGVLLSGVPGAGGDRLAPHRSGFVTKGDNPATNPGTDQASGISRDAAGRPELVPLARVEGKARGELPWLGLVKLALAGEPNEARPPASYVRIGSAYAPGDLWAMLGVSLAGLLGGPFAWDAWRARRARRKERA